MQLTKITSIDQLKDIKKPLAVLGIRYEPDFESKPYLSNTYATQGRFESVDFDLGYPRVMLSPTKQCFKHHPEDEIDLKNPQGLTKILSESTNVQIFTPLLVENFDEWEIYTF